MYAKLMAGVTCECDSQMYLEYHYDDDGERREWFVCPNRACEFHDQKFAPPRVPLAPYHESLDHTEAREP